MSTEMIDRADIQKFSQNFQVNKNMSIETLKEEFKAVELQKCEFESRQKNNKNLSIFLQFGLSRFLSMLVKTRRFSTRRLFCRYEQFKLHFNGTDGYEEVWN